MQNVLCQGCAKQILLACSPQQKVRSYTVLVICYVASEFWNIKDRNDDLSWVKDKSTSENATVLTERLALGRTDIMDQALPSQRQITTADQEDFHFNLAVENVIEYRRIY